MAYAPGMAAALSGTTIYQLRHWRRPAKTGPLLAPEISATPRVYYSFRDLLALRPSCTCAGTPHCRKSGWQSATSATWAKLSTWPSTASYLTAVATFSNRKIPAAHVPAVRGGRGRPSGHQMSRAHQVLELDRVPRGSRG